MSKSKYFTFLFAITSLVFIRYEAIGYAQDLPTSDQVPKAEDKKEDPCDKKIETVSKGTVASVGRYGSSGVALDVDTSGATAGDGASIVTGAIQYKSDSKCEAVLSNSSECFRYSVSFEVNSSSSKGSITSSSVSLSPGASKSVPFSCKKSENYSLKITKSSSTKAKSN